VEKSGRKRYITGMEEAPENGKELSQCAHGNGMNLPLIFLIRTTGLGTTDLLN
jgi:hypothetical protein